jgi:hypothetical protein
VLVSARLADFRNRGGHDLSLSFSHPSLSNPKLRAGCPEKCSRIVYIGTLFAH